MDELLAFEDVLIKQSTFDNNNMDDTVRLSHITTMDQHHYINCEDYYTPTTTNNLVDRSALTQKRSDDK